MMYIPLAIGRLVSVARFQEIVATPGLFFSIVLISVPLRVKTRMVATSGRLVKRTSSTNWLTS